MEFVGFLVVGFIVFCAVASWLEESNLSDEEKAERRRQRQEERHARRMLEIQAEHEKKQRKSALWHGVGGTVAKAGVGLLVKGITGSKHHHRH